MPARLAEAIFALAALKVMNHPRHPAHFAFWGKNILERTAQVVDSVVRTSFSHIFPHLSHHSALHCPRTISVTPPTSLVPGAYELIYARVYRFASVPDRI